MGVRAVPQPVRLDRKENLEVGWSVGGLRLARNMDKTCWMALSMLQLLAVRSDSSRSFQLKAFIKKRANALEQHLL